MMKKQEAMLARVIDQFAARFDKRAVLRGGMVLRVLGCERMTNDVDYVFVPFRSKKDVLDEVLEALREIPGAEIRHSMNSKCLRLVVTVDSVSIQIEIKTAMEMPVAALSNRSLAQVHGLPPRLIAVVDYPYALADKMAAWNERRLVRDVHDIWFYLKMGVRPDARRLSARLAKPVYSRLVPPDERFPGGGMTAFFRFLSERVQALDDRVIAESLQDFLPPDELPGLSMRFRAEMAKLL